ncbi:hypothetical protein E0Z10_g440 [Xylaria hypoxylon]|uniref:non-specific serine/threonine protein kinase n=1 Tax=Xylaria hypoxylon TaxID=37992 RepID=A0A4Z0Z7N2_9PEZI|nr:hypothetical protein E0Z10_g440 [Xylaria hypoxylon]
MGDTTNLGTESQDGINSAKDGESKETEDDLYRYEDMPYILGDIEDVQLYRKGGHHPVHLGDVLNNQFEVVHKLGSSGFGLVWLCYDTLHSKWRAVKIMTANHSKGGREGKIYGGPIDKWRMGLDPHDAQTATDVKEFCFQVTQAVRFLHKSGICHGDLKPGNILVTVKGIDDMGKKEMLELIGQPECWEVETRSGDHPAPRGPEYIVQPPQEYWWENHMAGSIAIIDF